MNRNSQTRIDRRRFIGATGALAFAGVAGLSRHGTLSTAAKGEASFFVRPNGNRGELRGYSLETGLQEISLPPGLLDVTGTRFVVAEPASAASLGRGGGALFSGVSLARSSLAGPATHTRLGVYDPRFGMLGGELADTWAFEGNWKLGGISKDAQWVALTSVPTDEQIAGWTANGGWQTDVMLVDTQTGTEPRQITLDGNFEVEVVSGRGDALFLLEYVPAANPDHYLVRLYDELAGGLQPGALRDKREPDEIMAGLAWDGVASPDGQWLLTLYLSSSKEEAFIHSLNLVDRYPVCIDLPSGTGDFSLLKQYSMLFSWNGQKLYAANTALGVVAHVDLGSFEIAESTTFAPTPPLPDAIRGANSRVTMRADERTIYFSSGQDIWAYDTIENAVTGPIPIPGRIIGLDASRDDTWVVVARQDEPLVVLDPEDGKIAPFTPMHD